MTDPILEPGNDNSSMAKLIYILYLVGLAIGLTSLVGVIIAYINKNESPEWLQTHFQFQIRTFWIGFLMLFIGTILVVVVIGWLVYLFFAVWLIIRCVKGFQLIDKGQAHPNPTTWMF